MSTQDRFEFFERMVRTMNESDVEVFSIQDHWTFDGYTALRLHLSEDGATPLTKLVLPGIEIRVQAPADFRLNFHFIFSDAVTPERLSAFRHSLSLLGGYSLTDDELRRFAGTIPLDKLRTHGFPPEARDDDSEMLKAGLMIAEATQKSVEQAMESFGSDEVLTVMAFDTHGGEEDLDWEKHAASDLWLLRYCHMVEARKQSNISLFLDSDSSVRPSVRESFMASLGGRPRAVTCGSDAHALGRYGKSDAGKYTWFRADATFEGLRHVVLEPSARVFIGARPPQLDRSSSAATTVISRVRGRKRSGASTDENWFAFDLPLNPGLVAVIGNKGSGKSALADIIALLGGSRRPTMEFLTRERFLAPPNRAQYFEASLVWSDGAESAWTRLDSAANPTKPERVTHLAQSHIEALCSDVGRDSEFERELRSVVFQHIPAGDRLGTSELEHLIDLRSAPHLEVATAIRSEIRETNRRLVQVQRLCSQEHVDELRGEFDLRMSEIRAHGRVRPDPGSEPPEPDGEATPESVQRSELRESRDELEKRVGTAREQEERSLRLAALAVRLRAKIDKLVHAVGQVRIDIANDLEEVGLTFDELVTFEVHEEVLGAREKAIGNDLSETKKLLRGDESLDEVGVEGETEGSGLLAELQAARTEYQRLVADLDAPRREYERRTAELAEWRAKMRLLVGEITDPTSLRGLARRMRHATKELPLELEQLESRRAVLAGRLHDALTKLTAEKDALLQHVQSYVDRLRRRMPGVELEFATETAIERFAESFFALVSHGKAGSFCGAEPGRARLRKLMRDRDFSSKQAFLSFVDGVLAALKIDARTGTASRISDQLRKGADDEQLLNMLFEMEYLRSNFTMRMSGRAVSALSPGEKGAMLILFFLLLDRSSGPLIIDQPEHNLDNESVVKLLVPAFRLARSKRQIVLVTHNPNLAVVCDADQIIHARMNKSDGSRVTYESGAIENPEVNPDLLRVLEGTEPAFRTRERRYSRTTRRITSV